MKIVSALHELHDRAHGPAGVRELLMDVSLLSLVDDRVPSEGDHRQLLVSVFVFRMNLSLPEE
jgi:hypothetical protein